MKHSKCDAIRPLISAALDGDLDEVEFVQLSEHLAGCPDCRQIHQEYFQLRDGLRSSSAPVPPPQLAQNIWQETVEKPPQPVIVRLASRASLKLGMSTMAASIIVVIIVAIFAAQGYDRQTMPGVASSQPVQNSAEAWPVSSPIRINFNKDMDRESVMENLSISPSSEHERLPTMWEGNSLIIGRSEDHSVLLRPETDYRITIREDAEDHHGNPLGEHWTLRFQTGPRDVSVTTPPSVEPDPGNQTETNDQDSSDLWEFGQGDGDDDESDDQQDDQTGDADPDVETESDDNDAQASENQGELDPATTENQEQEQEQPDPDPTPTPQQETVTNAGPDEDEAQESQPTATPKPEPTSTPEPDPTPEPTATDEPEPTPSAEPYPVRGAFGEVYWGRDEVADALGVATQEARSFLASEQEFQRGVMFRQHNETRNSILVFASDSPVHVYDNTYDPDVDEIAASNESDGLYAPGGYFGKTWNDESLESLIGLAVSPEPRENIDGAIQQFANGQLVYSRDNVYVIYADGNWDIFPVRSGSSGGFQGDDGTDNESDQNDGADDDEGSSDSDDDAADSGDGTGSSDQSGDSDDNSDSDSDTGGDEPAGGGEDETNAGEENNGDDETEQ